MLSNPGLVLDAIRAAALAQLLVSSAESPTSVGRLSVMIPVSGSDDTWARWRWVRTFFPLISMTSPSEYVSQRGTRSCGSRADSRFSRRLPRTRSVAWMPRSLNAGTLGEPKIGHVGRSVPTCSATM
jgi:hypothetical protein